MLKFLSYDNLMMIKELSPYLSSNRMSGCYHKSCVILSSNTLSFGKDNVAGLKGYDIVNWDDTEQCYFIDDIIPVNCDGWIYSLQLGNNYDKNGTVTSIQRFDTTEQTKIYVTNYISCTNLNEGTTMRIWFPEHPEQGNLLMGTGAMAFGWSTKATHLGTFTEGWNTHAYGKYAHSEGNSTQAGYGAHSEGVNSIASGLRSHAQNYATTASGENSTSEGYNTTASGENSHAEGFQSNANSSNAHAEGFKTTAAWNAHAEGNETSANGKGSHAEGSGTTATGEGSHAEGLNTTAEGRSSHTEGENSKATGAASHAQGLSTTASGHYSHAGGEQTIAKGKNSIANGYYTQANGASSDAGGMYTIANADYQTVRGKFNAGNSNALFMVGNGTNGSNRSNAFEVLQDGRATVGKPPQDSMDIVNKGYIDELKYKTALYIDFENSGTDTDGYITISMPPRSLLEIVIDDNVWAEHCNSYYQLYCGYDAHEHRLLQCSGRVYIESYSGLYENCVWYIPYNGSQSLAVNIRDLMNSYPSTNVTVSWLPKSQLTAELIEITSYYVPSHEFDSLENNVYKKTETYSKSEVDNLVNELDIDIKPYDYLGYVNHELGKTGYIALDFEGGVSADVEFSQLQDVETHIKTRLRVECADDAYHSHKFYRYTGNIQSVYIQYIMAGGSIGSGTWYFPVEFSSNSYSGLMGVSVVAKGILTTLGNLNARFVETLPEDVYEVKSTDYALASQVPTNLNNNSSYVGALYQTTNEATANYTAAFGYNSKATGLQSFVSGKDNQATGANSFASGNHTIASGTASMATGLYTTAADQNSFTSGYYTQTSRTNQTVVGEWNVKDPEAMFIVGNGESTKAEINPGRSNAFKVLKNGRAVIGEAPINNMEVANKGYVDVKVEGYCDSKIKDMSGNTYTILVVDEIPSDANDYTIYILKD